MLGNEVIDTSFTWEKFTSETCGKVKGCWNVGFVGDGVFRRKDPVGSFDVNNADIIISVVTVQDRGYNLPIDRKYTLEGEALEELEAASTRHEDAHAALWKAYEGTISIQDVFTRVVNASGRLDTICNKLSVLRDAKESNGMVPIKAKDVGCEPHLELRSDGENSQYILYRLIGLSSCLTYYRFESTSVEYFCAEENDC
ncbi:hypothetical protein EDD15DRAFT_2192059 [Pisolithus albus]|nr:hypothetical protein EDD15DRAFT_2192059 [Pisolithus albus]